MAWGKRTVIKLLGGELIVNTYGSSPADWERIKIPAFVRRAYNMTRVFESLRTGWIRSTRDVFATEGPGWAPLKASTLASRRFPGRPILRQTDRLYRSVTGGPGMIWKAGPRSLQYGSTVPYFVYHQRGTTQMAQRQVIVFGQQLRQQLKRAATRWVITGRV